MTQRAHERERLLQSEDTESLWEKAEFTVRAETLPAMFSL